MDNTGLKHYVLQSLSCMLTAEPNIRKTAEDRCKAMEISPQYPIVLLDIILEDDEGLEERQLAALVLKQYVFNNWNQSTVNYSNLVQIEPKVKDKIREQLTRLLQHDNSTIQATVAKVMAYIAQHDFPRDWLELPQIITEMLSSKMQNKVAGGLLLLEECIRHLDVTFVDVLYSVTFQLAFAISRERTLFDTKTRAHAVIVSVTLVLPPGENGSLLAPMHMCSTLNGILHTLCSYLREPYGPYSNFYLKSECLRALNVMAKRCPLELAPDIRNFLIPVVSEVMVRCALEYSAIIAGERDVPHDDLEDVNSPFLFESLITNAMEFIRISLTRWNSFLIPNDTLGTIVYNLITFMAPMDATVLKWKSDDEAYALCDGDKEIDSNIRISSNGLFCLLWGEFSKDIFLINFKWALEKHWGDWKMNSPNVSQYGWKVTEAIAYALGSISPTVKVIHKKGQVKVFELETYLEKLLGVVNNCTDPILMGRLLWLSGCYTEVFPSSHLQKFLTLAMDNLLNPPVRLLRTAAIRAFLLYTQNMPKAVVDYLVAGAVVNLYDTLFQVIPGTVPAITEGALEIIRNTLAVVPDFTASIMERLTQTIISVFAEQRFHGRIAYEAIAIVQMLCKIPACTELLTQGLVPLLINILDANVEKAEPICAFDLQARAFDTLTIIAKYSPRPLFQGLVDRGLVIICRAILKSYSSAVMQSAAECLRSLLVLAPDQVRYGNDCHGRTFINHVMDVLNYLMDPQTTEMTGLTGGRLCVTAMSLLQDEILPHIPYLVRCCLSQLQKRDRLAENTLLVLAYLLYNHVEIVFGLLQPIPGPRGHSALQYVLETWMSKNIETMIQFERNLSLLALSKVLYHLMLNPSTRYIEIANYCNAADREKEPDELGRISAAVKICSLLTSEMAKNLQTRAFVQAQATNPENSMDDEPDTEEETWEPEPVDPLDEQDAVYTMDIGDCLYNSLKHIMSSLPLDVIAHMYTGMPASERRLILDYKLIPAAVRLE